MLSTFVLKRWLYLTGSTNGKTTKHVLSLHFLDIVAFSPCPFVLKEVVVSIYRALNRLIFYFFAKYSVILFLKWYYLFYCKWLTLWWLSHLIWQCSYNEPNSRHISGILYVLPFIEDVSFIEIVFSLHLSVFEFYQFKMLSCFSCPSVYSPLGLRMHYTVKSPITSDWGNYLLPYIW